LIVGIDQSEIRKAGEQILWNPGKEAKKRKSVNWE
jgi:hypothetical protein